MVYTQGRITELHHMIDLANTMLLANVTAHLQGKENLTFGGHRMPDFTPLARIEKWSKARDDALIELEALIAKERQQP